MNNDKHGFSTRSIHAGYEPDSETGALVAPISKTASYVFKNTEHAANLFALKELGYIYSRLTNPTVGALESKLAALEGGAGATCTSSGHAAQLLTFLLFYNLATNLLQQINCTVGQLTSLQTAFHAHSDGTVAL